MCTALLEPRPGDTTDPNGTSPLHLAAKNGHIDIIRYGWGGGGVRGSLPRAAYSWLGSKTGAAGEPWGCGQASGTRDASSRPHKGCPSGGWGVGFYSLPACAACRVALWRLSASLSLHFPMLKVHITALLVLG